MKNSIAIAAFVVAAGGSAGLAALPNPYDGSAALFQVTRQAITAAGLSPPTNYIGSGSLNGIAAMVGSSAPYSFANAKQQTVPTSRMIKNEANVCRFNGGSAGSGLGNASTIVIGLDAVTLLSSINSGGSTACNGTADKTGTGLAHSGTTGVFAGSTANQTWKWVLALIYGGKDLSPGGVTDCNSAARHALVANWSKLFQNGCANGVATCNDTTHAGALWHAFRRDDNAATADTFASLLGLSPSNSASAVNGFGASPYCNSLNWDTTTQPLDSTGTNTLYPAAPENGICGLGPHDQFTGPGGIPDPAATAGACKKSGHCKGPGDGTAGPICTVGGTACADGSTCVADLCRTDGSLTCTNVASDTCSSLGHRAPPASVWGTNPLGIAGAPAWDVLPTQEQDNDPIRRPCLGVSANNSARAGEEVCNLDGALGLVLPIVTSDWIVGQSFNGGPQLTQYPTNDCNAFAAAKSVQVLNCAPRGTQHHDGACPNGDSEIGGACIAPVDTVHNRSDCINSPSRTPTLHVRTLPLNYGRVYNLHMRDGTVPTGGGKVTYAQYPVAALNSSLDFAGNYGRIHQVQTVLADGSPACQLANVDDQIGCLTQADPCSIGFTTSTGKTWGDNYSPPVASNIDALRVNEIYPTTSTVQALGTQNSYEYARKLYFGTLIGFGNIAATTGDPTATDEVALARFESNPSSFNPIITSNGFFTLGSQSPAGTDTQFCEDFNEDVTCNSGLGSGGALGRANLNGCTGNPTGIPTANTVCGDGTIQAYEECDDGQNNGKSGFKCSAACRCTTALIGNPSGSGDSACQ
jgi:hypothetical protein